MELPARQGRRRRWLHVIRWVLTLRRLPSLPKWSNLLAVLGLARRRGVRGAAGVGRRGGRVGELALHLQLSPPSVHVLSIQQLDLQLRHVQQLPPPIRQEEDQLQLQGALRPCGRRRLRSARPAVASLGQLSGRLGGRLPLFQLHRQGHCQRRPVKVLHDHVPEMQEGVRGPAARLRRQEEQAVAHGEPDLVAPPRGRRTQRPGLQDGRDPAGAGHGATTCW
mmetsp:Transcript_23520/g.67209  ORF Transcript_23520/g.67209 Transcript_23520/m.67209 type:complete len:222 (-) Transcript_23520:1842-2507(-)